MSASATSQELITYFNQLSSAEQNTVLQMLKTFLTNRKKETTLNRWKIIQKNWCRQMQKLKPAILFCMKMWLNISAKNRSCC